MRKTNRNHSPRITIHQVLCAKQTAKQTESMYSPEQQGKVSHKKQFKQQRTFGRHVFAEGDGTEGETAQHNRIDVPHCLGVFHPVQEIVQIMQGIRGKGMLQCGDRRRRFQPTWVDGAGGPSCNEQRITNNE